LGGDAPEGRQVCQNANGQGYACGDVARDQLVGLINGRIVRCAVLDRDSYGRAVSRCVVGSTDLGEAMVRAGWAVDHALFSRGAYASAEAQARRGRRGLWAGRFETPSTWRAAVRQARPAPAAPPQAGCVIKGNLNARGRRIFHVPGAGRLRGDPHRDGQGRALVLFAGRGAGGGLDGGGAVAWRPGRHLARYGIAALRRCTRL
jgi:hypothetical protein